MDEYRRFIDALARAEWEHDTDYDGEQKWEELSTTYRVHRIVRMEDILHNAVTSMVTPPPDTGPSAPS